MGNAQPWLHPDLTNAVCSSMSIGDVKVLANRQALEAQRAAQEVSVRDPSRAASDDLYWDPLTPAHGFYSLANTKGRLRSHSDKRTARCLRDFLCMMAALTRSLISRHTA